MKKVICIILICFFLLPMKLNAQTDDWQKQFDFSEIDGTLEEIFPKEKISFSELVEMLICGETETFQELFGDFILDQFFYELKASRAGLIQILLLVIAAAVFSNFSSMFKSTQVSEISFSVMYLFLITICLSNYQILVTGAEANMERLMHFMEVLGPVYFLAVTMATGSATSVAFYEIILLLIYAVQVLILGFLIPLTKIYVIIRILSEMSSELHLSKFAELLETIVSWTLKTLVTGVIGLNVIQGLLSPAIDTVKRNVLIKGGGALPIIGDAIGGITEVVLGTTVLIKNGIGVVGMIICLLICIPPIFQMGITALLYQLVTALMQPISDKRMVNCVSGMADGIKMLLRIVFTSAVLFLLTIAIVATATGGT